MGIHYLIVLIGTPLVLIGIGYMYLLESKWLNDFEMDNEEDIV